jgi:hypothetical protein
MDSLDFRRKEKVLRRAPAETATEFRSPERSVRGISPRSKAYRPRRGRASTDCPRHGPQMLKSKKKPPGDEPGGSRSRKGSVAYLRDEASNSVMGSRRRFGSGRYRPRRSTPPRAPMRWRSRRSRIRRRSGGAGASWVPAYLHAGTQSASKARVLGSARADTGCRAHKRKRRRLGRRHFRYCVLRVKLSAKRGDRDVRRAHADVPGRGNVAWKGHRRCGDHRRQEHSSSPHDRLLQ